MPFLYHPLVVHFPVALWLTSFLFDLLYLRRKEAFFARASGALIGLGLLAAAVSIVSGFMDYRPLVAAGVGQAFIDQHRVHSLMAYASTLLYLVILLIRRRPRSTTVYVAPAVIAAVLIAITGYRGGEIRRVM
ncbi:MAG: hypothetical protein HYU65_05515 [Armatimonadetes bacterium]|nr:hypothetical protein [Armatimonadota bacterium]